LDSFPSERLKKGPTNRYPYLNLRNSKNNSSSKKTPFFEIPPLKKVKTIE
jgi:hypothetical protein